MDEWQAIDVISSEIDIGDDCGVYPYDSRYLLGTTDMLHRETDFPDELTPYTKGWRSMAVSLSDIAAMGGEPLFSMIAVGLPEFSEEDIHEFTEGALDVCRDNDCIYAGGDMDRHHEETIVSSVIGEASTPIYREGSESGDAVCVTGELGRTALALNKLGSGESETVNELFRFNPRIEQGLSIARHASSMMDISDGLAVSLHQLSEASGNGFSIDSAALPHHEGLESMEDIVFTGDDYELLFTIPRDKIDDITESFEYSVIGECIESGIYMDGDELPKKGYHH